MLHEYIIYNRGLLCCAAGTPFLGSFSPRPSARRYQKERSFGRKGQRHIQYIGAAALFRGNPQGCARRIMTFTTVLFEGQYREVPEKPFSGLMVFDFINSLKLVIEVLTDSRRSR